MARQAKIRKAVFELTNRCNLRCRMCDIWEQEPKADFSPAIFENILGNGSLSRLKSMSFTGGEPFLLKNLGAYYGMTRKYLPKADINISTNGFDTKSIINFLENADQRKTSVTISFDGIHSHDRIRGRPGSKENLMDTARSIRGQFPDVALGLKFTITPWNRSEILETAEYADEQGFEFYVKMIDELRNYTNRNRPMDIKGMLDGDGVKMISGQLIEMNKRKLSDNPKHVKYIIRYLRAGSKRCGWSKKKIFVRHDGEVFLCRKKQSIGNLGNRRLHELLDSDEHASVRKAMRDCKESYCMEYSND